MTYNIVCVSDDAYVQHLAVMLTSLMHNNPQGTFDIYVLTTGIGKASQERLQELCSRYGSRIRFIEGAFDEVAGFDSGRWSRIIFLKMLTPHYLPPTVERYLFLDVDMVVLDNIDSLYNTVFDEGKLIAACEDMPDCIGRKRQLNLAADDIYINSGVMVVDLKAWRQKDADRPCVPFMLRVKDTIANEQDVIALYFRGELQLLPIRWNMVTFYFYRKPQILPQYLPQLPEAQRHPAIVHFAAPIKPWYRDSLHPYRHLYHEYLQESRWPAQPFGYYESLSPRQRFNRCVRVWLNRIGLLRDERYQMLIPKSSEANPNN